MQTQRLSDFLHKLQYQMLPPQAVDAAKMFGYNIEVFLGAFTTPPSMCYIFSTGIPIETCTNSRWWNKSLYKKRRGDMFNSK